MTIMNCIIIMVCMICVCKCVCVCVCVCVLGEGEGVMQNTPISLSFYSAQWSDTAPVREIVRFPI